MSQNKSAFCRVFNQNKQLVIEGITRFSYVHTELADDASYLTIETQDLDLPDNPDLQEGKKLILVWGYLNGLKRSHIVYIWDVVPTFNKNGLSLEIKCYCKAAYMSLNSSQKVWDTNFTMEDVVDDLSEEYGLTKKTNGINGTPANSNISTVEAGGKTPAILDFTNSNILLARDNTAFVQRYNFKKYTDESLPQANQSDKGFVEKLASQEPVDNLFVTGRDEDLIIARRNFNQAPYKAYIFRGEPGTLLSFIPATHNSSAEKKATANITSGWDELNKSFIQGENTIEQSGAPVLGNIVNTSQESLLRKGLLDALSSPADRPLSIGGISQEPFVEVDPVSGNQSFKTIHTASLDSTKKVYVQIVKKGTRPSAILFNKQGKLLGQTAAIDGVGRIETRGVVIKDPKEYIHTVETKKNDIAGVGVNRQSKQLQDLNSADMIMEGDPELESSKIISIKNVSKKFSGNYYITSVKHEVLKDSGYLCYVKGYRTGTSKIGIGNNAGSKVDADALGLYKNTLVEVPVDGSIQLLEVPARVDR